VSSFQYSLEDNAFENYSEEAINDLKNWPEQIHHLESDEVLGQTATEVFTTIKYRSMFRDMLMDFLVNHQFHKQGPQ
jgi:hypothetical protein